MSLNLILALLYKCNGHSICRILGVMYTSALFGNRTTSEKMMMVATLLYTYLQLKPFANKIQFHYLYMI
jgi:hypothetical protein